MAVSKSLLVFGGVAACSVSLMGLPQPQKNYLAEMGRAGVFSTCQWLFSRVIDFARNEERSRFLLTQNGYFALDNMALREAAWENVRLRQALTFVGQKSIPQIDDTIVVNAGTDRGIGVDWPVVTAEGLVGHVVQVDGQSAVVQLLMRSRISAIVQESRAQGIVSWVQGRRFRLRFVDKSSNVVEGNHIISSGLGGRYPKGIPIGRVVEVSEDPREPVFQNVYMESMVNFLDLEEVFIMRPD